MSEEREPDGRAASDRRQFMGSASRVAMTAGLVGGYGGFGLIIGRYLYPARPGDRIWHYVAESDAIPGRLYAVSGARRRDDQRRSVCE